MTALQRSEPAPKTGIIHLGPGAFFRAFNAVFTQDAMDQTGGDWGITAVSLRSTTARDQLAPQDGMYHAVTLAPGGEVAQVIGSVTQVLVAPEDPAAVIAAMAAPDVKIVSLTITEKGYCHNPATGRLNLDHVDIQHDMAQLDAPKSAIGFLVAGLAARRAKGLTPFTILSCDNLPSNGDLTKSMVLEFARCVDADLADWIAEQVRFPATMVDRITPATTPEDVDRLHATTGLRDAAAVFHEPFKQWVIEDRFVAGRPAWDAVGAQMVASVEAHELMKLRCLNGTHSALAYLGYLAGHQTIADCAADPIFAGLCQHLWGREILPTVPQPEGEDLPAYAAALLDRYRNPAIRHRTWQIAMDGSQKLPQRILGTIADNLAQGRDFSALALVVAGWMRYVGGIDEQGGAIDVRDPLKDRLRAATETSDPVAALLALDAVFPPDLAADARFRTAVQGAYEQLVAQGARGAVASVIGEQQ